jgi:hypothetical protein
MLDGRPVEHCMMGSRCVTQQYVSLTKQSSLTMEEIKTPQSTNALTHTHTHTHSSLSQRHLNIIINCLLLSIRKSIDTPVRQSK